jgi:hypothetical protein
MSWSRPLRCSWALAWVLWVEMMGLEPTTPCLQSQIGPYDDLRAETTAQLKATLALSVVVRWEPVGTAVNGTLVARRVMTTWHAVVPLAPP